MLKSATDQGIRYITQGGGSGVAFALVEALNKLADREPQKSAVFLNYSAMDPGLTNDRCSFWHFRFYPSSEMKIEALTTYMKRPRPDIKKVYLINQNYTHGQQVSRPRGLTWPQAARRGDRRRRLRAHRLGARLLALHGEDQGVGRRHRHHLQLGQRPVVAVQGGARISG